MTEAQRLAQLLAAKSAELKDFIGDDPTKRTLSAEDVVEIKKRNDELNEIEDQRAAAFKEEQAIQEIAQKNRERLDAYRTPVDSVGHGSATKGVQPDNSQKSLGQLFTEHKDFLGAPSRRQVTVNMDDYEFKTTMTTSAGFAPSVVRTDRVIPYANRRPVVADLIPQDTTTQSAIKYMRETTFTNAAALVAENAAKPESALAFTEVTANMGKIATWIPVTEEQLDDVPQARALINNRLILMLQLAEEVELLTGVGAIAGLIPNAGQTQAKGADPVPTAVYKAFTKIRYTGFAEPSGVVFHPNDWEPVRLLQDSTGRYIWGDPWVEGIERIWGKPVIVTPAETENTVLVGDFATYTHIDRKQGITLKTTDSHASLFISNVLVMLAEERLTLEIYRLNALCTVTGV